MQKLQLIGNLGKDPEIRYSQGGVAMVNFSLATTERWNDKQGQRQEKTEWHKIKAFGKQAETLEKYLSKGDTVYIDGQLETRSYDKDGQAQYITEVKVREFQFLPGNRDAGGSGDSKSKYRDNKTPMAGGQDHGNPVDDDLPF